MAAEVRKRWTRATDAWDAHASSPRTPNSEAPDAGSTRPASTPALTPSSVGSAAASPGGRSFGTQDEPLMPIHISLSFRARYNACLWLVALPATVMLAQSLSPTAAMLCVFMAAAIYALDLAGYREPTIILYGMGVLLVACFASVLITLEMGWGTLLSIAFGTVVVMFSAAMGGWGLLQFDWMYDEAKDFMATLQVMVFNLLPVCAMCINIWGLGTQWQLVGMPLAALIIAPLTAGLWSVPIRESPATEGDDMRGSLVPPTVQALLWSLGSTVPCMLHIVVDSRRVSSHWWLDAIMFAAAPQVLMAAIPKCEPLRWTGLPTQHRHAVQSILSILCGVVVAVFGHLRYLMPSFGHLFTLSPPWSHMCIAAAAMAFFAIWLAAKLRVLNVMTMTALLSFAGVCIITLVGMPVWTYAGSVLGAYFASRFTFFQRPADYGACLLAVGLVAIAALWRVRVLLEFHLQAAHVGVGLMVMLLGLGTLVMWLPPLVSKPAPATRTATRVLRRRMVIWVLLALHAVGVLQTETMLISQVQNSLVYSGTYVTLTTVLGCLLAIWCIQHQHLSITQGALLCAVYAAKLALLVAGTSATTAVWIAMVLSVTIAIVLLEAPRLTSFQAAVASSVTIAAAWFGNEALMQPLASLLGGGQQWRSGMEVLCGALVFSLYAARHPHAPVAVRRSASTAVVAAGLFVLISPRLPDAADHSVATSQLLRLLIFIWLLLPLVPGLIRSVVAWTTGHSTLLTAAASRGAASLNVLVITAAGVVSTWAACLAFLPPVPPLQSSVLLTAVHVVGVGSISAATGAALFCSTDAVTEADKLPLTAVLRVLYASFDARWIPFWMVVGLGFLPAVVIVDSSTYQFVPNGFALGAGLAFGFSAALFAGALWFFALAVNVSHVAPGALRKLANMAVVLAYMGAFVTCVVTNTAMEWLVPALATLLIVWHPAETASGLPAYTRYWMPSLSVTVASVTWTALDAWQAADTPTISVTWWLWTLGWTYAVIAGTLMAHLVVLKYTVAASKPSWILCATLVPPCIACMFLLPGVACQVAGSYGAVGLATVLAVSARQQHQADGYL